jgi:hypothetical protein
VTDEAIHLVGVQFHELRNCLAVPIEDRIDEPAARRRRGGLGNRRRVQSLVEHLSFAPRIPER